VPLTKQARHFVKIVFIIDSLQRYGTQRFLTHLVRGLRDLGYVQTVIALNNRSDADIEDELSSAGCSIIRIGKFALLLAGAGWFRLVAILRRSKPDLVLTMLDFADTLGRPAARLAGCGQLVTLIRARNLAKPPWRRWLDRHTITWADKVVFNSERIVSYGLEREGIRERQVRVIPNGVEDLRARSGSLRSDRRKELDLKPTTLLLGWMGRLSRQKNLPLLLRACSRLTSTREYKILILGDGPERARTLSVACELKLNDRVIWLGSRSDVEGWLATMDLFVHTADFEGMPNALMEAMAMGLPVIASDVDGNRELIQDGISGFLVPAGDVAAFAGRIDELISNRDLANRMGEAAHHHILERFSIARMIQAYHELFLSLSNRGPS
jgi:glycosyltransferase involved in cell wall biosynthesis